MITRDAPAEQLLLGCLLSGRDLALPAARRAGLHARHFTNSYYGIVYSRLLMADDSDVTLQALAGDDSLGLTQVLDLYCRYNDWRERIEQRRFQRWLSHRWKGNPEEFPHLWHEDVAASFAERVVRLARARAKIAEAYALSEGLSAGRPRGGLGGVGI